MSPADVAIGLLATGNAELLRSLTDRLARSHHLPAGPIFTAIRKREELGSTGTGSGVVIPHARIPDIDKATGFLAHRGTAIDFDAIDDRPVDLVFVLLLPAHAEPASPRARKRRATAQRKPNGWQD